MGNSESILGTLKYLDNISNRSIEKKPPTSNVVSEKRIVQEPKNSYVPEKKLKTEKKNPISAAEPHLKQLAGMLSEELANIKRLQEEELERVKREELARIRVEEAERIRLEAIREKIRLEEEEKIRLEKERLLTSVEIQNAYQEPLKEDIVEESKPVKTEVEQISEYFEKTYRKKDTPSYLASENKKQNLKEQTDFVTFEDLKKHYVDFLAKLNTQLASLGGGGEVLMRGLDDVDMETIQDGDFISYDAASRTFVGGSIPPGPQGTIEGGSY